MINTSMMQTAIKIAFPDVTFTPEQMAAVSQMATLLFDAEAQVAERDATIERYAMESVAKDMRIESLTASLDDMRNRWKSAEDDWMQLRAQLAERDATILSLRALRAERDELIAQVTKILGGYPDSDLLSLATTVAAGYERWCDGHDAQVEALRAQVATLNERLSRCTCTDDYGDIAE